MQRTLLFVYSGIALLLNLIEIIYILKEKNILKLEIVLLIVLLLPLVYFAYCCVFMLTIGFAGWFFNKDFISAQIFGNIPNYFLTYLIIKMFVEDNDLEKR